MAYGMAAGGLIGGAFSLGAAALTAKKNMELADRQMRFQKYMSSTAYQRTMKDMAKAGLNPILAAKLGGASTPPGAYHPIDSGIADRAISSAKEGAAMAAQLKGLVLQNEQTRAQTAKTVEEGRGAKATADMLEAEVPKAKAREEIEGDIWRGIQNSWRELPSVNSAKEFWRKDQEEGRRKYRDRQRDKRLNKQKTRSGGGRSW